MFALLGAAVEFEGSRRLSFPTFECRSNRCAITGPNGSGKTTLLSVLIGRKSLVEGELVREFRRPFYIPTNPRRVLLPWHSLQRNIEICFDREPLDPEEFFSQFRMDFDVLRFQRVASLSQGEAAVAAIYIAIGLKPDLLVLDEILANLHPYNQMAMIAFFAGPAVTAIGIVLVTHSLGLPLFEDPWQHLELGDGTRRTV